VTHEEHVARHAARIIRLQDGRVLSDLPIRQDHAERNLVKDDAQEKIS
jgi:ABC-type lipoprotein export system ATPase subunit